MEDDINSNTLDASDSPDAVVNQNKGIVLVALAKLLHHIFYRTFIQLFIEKT